MRYVGLGRDNLRSHFVFRPRHAPEWLHARFLPGVVLPNEEELTGKTFTTSLNTTNPSTYVKFIFLRTSPLTVHKLSRPILCLGANPPPPPPCLPSVTHTSMLPEQCACTTVRGDHCQPSRRGRDGPDSETQTRRPARRPQKADLSRFVPTNNQNAIFNPLFSFIVFKPFVIPRKISFLFTLSFRFFRHSC